MKSLRKIQKSLVFMLTILMMLAVVSNPVFAGTATGLDSLSYTVQQGWKYLDSSVTISSASNNWTDGYLDIAMTSGVDTGDQLRILSSGSLTVAGDAVSWGGTRIGTIDPTYNGVNGQRLRINFSASLINSGFETGNFSGWTVNTSFPGLSGDTPSGISQSATVQTGTVYQGSYAAQLSISGNVVESCGTAHGPEITSNIFYAQAGNTLSLRWNAIDSGDDYDVYGYLVNASTGVEQQLFYGRGDNTGGWVATNATVSSSVCPSGTCGMRFRFLAGTYDATCGNYVGSTMYIDGINVVTATATDAAVDYIVEHLEYQNNSNNPNTNKTYTLTMQDSASTGTASAGITVSKASTTTTITSDTPDPSVYGQNYTVNVSVASQAPSSGTPVGSVNISNGTNSCTATLSGGSGSCALPSNSVGAITLTATYGGTTLGYYGSSTSTSHNVNKASSITTITSDTPDPSLVGQNYTVSVSVAASAPGSGTPGGSVSVNDGTSSCSITLSGGSGSCLLPSLAMSEKTLTAVYAGDANFTGSSAPTRSHSIIKADSALTITSDGPDPSKVGQDYTVGVSVVAVAPGTGTPSGVVTVVDGLGNTCPITLSGGSGSCVLPSTSAQGLTVSASYPGDINFNGSSDTESHTVEKANTQIILTSPYNPAYYGAPIQITANVSSLSPGTYIPVGQVQFKVNGSNYGAPVNLSDGVATSTLLPAPLGTYAITADYLGTANYNTSSAVGFDQVIEKAPTTTVVTSSLNPSIYGQNVTFTATVNANSPSLAIPNGTVQFRIDGVNYGAVVALNGSGIAIRTVPFTALWPDVHDVTAVYSGATNFLGSNNTASPLVQTVNKANPVITITPSENPIVTGQPISLVIKAAGNPAYIGIPTGTVTLLLDGVAYAGPLTLAADGTVTINNFSTTSGNHEFTVQYSGDDYFVNVADVISDPVTVNKADTLTTISGFDPMELVVGQASMVSVNVTAFAPGVGTPDGQVEISNGTNTCTVTLVSGAGSCLLTPTATGNPELSAEYFGSDSFNGSLADPLSGPVVIPAETSIGSLTFDPTSIVVGQPASFSVTVVVDEPGSGTPLGTVLIGNGTDSCEVTLVAGSGSCEFTPTAPGQPELLATYSGDSNFNSSEGTFGGPLVSKAFVTAVVTSSSATSVYGQPVFFSVNVTVDEPGDGEVSGSVQFYLDGALFGDPEVLTDGAADSMSVSNLDLGEHSIYAVYSGNDNLLGNTSDSILQTVVPVGTTITLESTRNPAPYGDSVLVIATVVANDPSTAIPSGAVQFKVNGVNYGAPIPLDASGKAEKVLPYTALWVGTHEITGVYVSNSPKFNGSNNFADPLMQVIGKADTEITIQASVSPSDFGQAVTFDISVDPLTANFLLPTGTVEISIDGVGLGSALTLDENGAATSISISTLAVGYHDISISYSGDEQYLTNDVEFLNGHEVRKSDSTTSIIGFDNSALILGQPMNVAVSVQAVAPGVGTPGGTVVISDGTNICNITLTGGSGSCDLSTTLPGVRTLRASYGGDSNFYSSSDSEEMSVINADTITTISDSPDPSVYGQSYTVNVDVTTVTPDIGTPEGDVAVSDDSGNSCNITLVSGSGSCDLPSNSVGTTTLTALYSGDADFNGSNDTEEHQVNKADSVTTISSDEPDASVYGQDYTVNFSVAADSLELETPGGTVTISDGLNSCGPVTLVDGSGSCDLHSTSPGEKTLTATYSGDAIFNESNDTESHTVNKGSIALTIIDSPDPTFYGQPYIVSYRLDVIPPASGTPTGMASISDGHLSCINTNISGNTGSCTFSYLEVGLSNLTAHYYGDSNFNVADATDTHTIIKAGSVTRIDSDIPSTTVIGQSYTVNVRVYYQQVDGTYYGTGTPTGTVTVSDGLGHTCPATLSGGTGSCSLPSTATGVRTLTATYTGDGNFNSSSDTEPHSVIKSNSETTITSDLPDASVFGQSYTVNFSVAAASPGAGTPSGTVTISDGENSCGPVTLEEGLGSCDLPSTSVGAITLTATYIGDANFNGSNDTESHMVNKADTTTAISSDDPDASVFGQNYTVNFSVTADLPGAGTPTGTVTISDGENSCDPVTLEDGLGSCVLTSTSVGAKTLTATYIGDANFNGSNDIESHTVNKADTTTTISSDEPDASVFGQSYTVNFSVAAVLPGAGTPGGTVTISDGVNSCGPVTLEDGSGSCDLPSTSFGPKTLTATYIGDDNFNGSNDTEDHQVNKADTLTTISSDEPDASVFGQDYTVNFSVAAASPGVGTPSGTVTISDGENSCQPVTLVDGLGSCNLPSTSVGSKTLTATYIGDDYFNGSNDTESHTVNKADTLTTITSDLPDASVFGQNYTVNFSVTAGAPGAGIPGGTVTISDGENSCQPVTLVDGSGSCNLSSTLVGAKTLTATYSGDANFNESNDSEDHQVNKADTLTSITSDDPDASVYGQDYTVVFSVTAVLPGAGTPGGTVTISDGENSCQPVTLEDGSGSCDLPSTSVAPKTLTATYSGDASFNSSEDEADHTVVKANTEISLETPYNPAVYGAPIQITATVIAEPLSQTTPDGQVQFRVNGSNYGAAVNLEDGVAVSSLLPAPLGSYTITADYLGTLNYNTSSAVGFDQVIEKAPTTVMVTSSLNPSIYGQSVTFTVNVSANLPSLAIPNGTIQLKIDGVDYGVPVTLNAEGVAVRTVPFTALWPDVHDVTAVYSGASNFLSSNNTASPLVQTVFKANPVITITPSENPIVTGQPISLVINAAGNPAYIGIPTGTVTLLLDGVTYAGPFTLAADGTVTINDFHTSGGSHEFTIQYSGDDYYVNVADVISDPVTVNKADTLTTISGFDPMELVVGQSTLVSVNVAAVLPGAGFPDGQVEISNGTDTCTVTLVSGAGSCLLTPTSTGNPEMSAEYFGSDGFNGSLAEPLPGPVVTKPNTSITSITFDPTVLVVGQPTVVTVVVDVVEPGSGTATGEVTISNDVDSCIITLVDGTGSCEFTPTASGQPELNAAYEGDANFNGSSSSVSGPVVNLADTSIDTFSYDPVLLVVGQPTTVSVAVSVDEPGSGVATGEVTISNGTDSCVVTLVSGAGTCDLTPTAPGSPELSADYSGDSNFNSSSTSTAGPVVSKAETSITSFDFAPATLKVGQATTINVVVSVDEPGNGIASGEVTINNGVDECVVTLVDGAGSCVFTPTNSGAPLLSAEYTGDLNFNASLLEVAGPEVSPAYTTISTFSFDPASLVVGQSSTVSIVVSSNAPGSGFPDGEVVVSNGDDQCVVTLVDGAGNCEFRPTTTGQPILSATYAGNENYNGYYREIEGPVVIPAETSIGSLTFDPTSLVVGQPASISVTVVVDEPGSGTPTGTVLIGNGTDRCEATLVAGSGSCEFIPTAPGQPDLSAVYSGDSNFNGSEGTFGGLLVSKAFVTAVVSSSSASSVYGQSVFFSVAVTVDEPGSGAVSGTVQFYLDGSLFGDSVVLIDGSADSASISNLDLGEHTIYAVYSGDDNFEGNTSDSIDQTVVPAGTTITIESTRNPAPYGDSVLVIATVVANDPSNAVPTGAVQFKVNGVNYGAPIPLDASGKAEKVLPYTALWVGTHEVTGVFISSSLRFNGSDNFADPLMQVIGLADTDITVLASVNPSRFGEAASFSIHVADVTDNFLTPTGTVQISIDGSALGSALTLDENGDATSISIDTLAVGMHSIEITYSGDEQYAPNTATFTDGHEVSKSDTTTSIDSISVSDLVVGQTTSVSVSVAAVAPGNGIPDGSVTVSNGVDECQVTLVDGSGSCSLTLTNAGQLDLVATYAASTSFNGSFSESAQGPSVIAADTAFADFTYLPEAVVVGQAITVSVTLNTEAPGAGIPTGSVIISNGTDSCEAVLDESGYGTCELIPTTSGQFDLEAVYDGDGNFNSTTATVSPGPSVSPADTTVEISGPASNHSGTAARWIATVNAVEPGSGEVSGNVQFFLNGIAFGDPVELVAGQAESQIAYGLEFENHEITAQYLGTGDYNSSVSEIWNYLVSPFQIWLPIIIR